MTQQTTQIPVSSIILDEAIYPRKGIDLRRVGMFAENIRDGIAFDPMAGGGVTSDTCLAMGRRCWAFDMMDRPDTRPEIEPFTWDISSAQGLLWPVSAKEKPDLIIFDPPYFDKKAAGYDEKSISGLSQKAYLDFLEVLPAGM